MLGHLTALSLSIVTLTNRLDKLFLLSSSSPPGLETGGSVRQRFEAMTDAEYKHSVDIINLESDSHLLGL